MCNCDIGLWSLCPHLMEADGTLTDWVAVWDMVDPLETHLCLFGYLWLLQVKGRQAGSPKNWKPKGPPSSNGGMATHKNLPVVHMDHRAEFGCCTIKYYLLRSTRKTGLLDSCSHCSKRPLKVMNNKHSKETVNSTICPACALPVRATELTLSLTLLLTHNANPSPTCMPHRI